MITDQVIIAEFEESGFRFLHDSSGTELAGQPVQPFARYYYPASARPILIWIDFYEDTFQISTNPTIELQPDEEPRLFYYADPTSVDDALDLLQLVNLIVN